MDSRDALIELIKERGCQERKEPVALSSGGTTRIYLDIKACLADGHALNMATAALLHHMVKKLDRWNEVTAIGGPTMGADVLAHGMAARWGGHLKWFSIREQIKTDHGLSRWIEGATLGPEDLVMITDDVVSTGRSLRDSYDRVTETGAAVLGILPLVDRSGIAHLDFDEYLVPYHPLLTHHDLGIPPL